MSMNAMADVQIGALVERLELDRLPGMLATRQPRRSADTESFANSSATSRPLDVFEGSSP
jgi:hypothetical protein